jgi:hypothetical protein
MCATSRKAEEHDGQLGTRDFEREPTSAIRDHHNSNRVPRLDA